MSTLYWHKTPAILSKLFPGFLWHKSREEKNIYLSFDDGPIPEITEYVIAELEEFGAKGTFFCVGENIRKNPRVFHKIIELGHSVGNHTFNHLNGRRVSTDYYLKNIELCQSAMAKERYHRIQKIFRPPFGMLKWKSALKIRENYSIVMWDVLTGDFDERLTPEKCLYTSLKSIRNGSIVVFHDSIKSEKKLRFVLPRLLVHFAEKGYKFSAL